MPKMHLAAIGPTSKGEEREGREERGDGKGGEGNRLPPKVKASHCVRRHGAVRRLANAERTQLLS